VKHVVVVGAGTGRLTAAAVLPRAGLDVTVLEAHIYAGGCAGTFFHQGYRFDAGVTSWPVRTDVLTLTVHLPDSGAIPRWTDPVRWKVERLALGPHGPRTLFSPGTRVLPSPVC
jgi:phytoene dehydrogenase-like protein